MRYHLTFIATICLLCHLCAAAGVGRDGHLASARADAPLFRDDFNGNKLDADEWGVSDGSYPFNRAYFGLTPTVSGGVARFRLDTYNPSRPGANFLGTHIYAYQEFSRGFGLELEARVRTGAMPSGIITSFFTWAQNRDATTDEIDFEFLTSQINAARARNALGQPVAVTTWNNWDRDPQHNNDRVHHSTANPHVSGLDLNNFNVFTIRWLPHRTEWLVNGQVVRSTSLAHPDAPLRIYLNFWVPDGNWPEAYSAALQPAKVPRENETYYYDVDYVEVRALPPPMNRMRVVARGRTTDDAAHKQPIHPATTP